MLRSFKREQRKRIGFTRIRRDMEMIVNNSNSSSSKITVREKKRRKT